MANRRRDPEREVRWREVMARQAASGLSVRAFCRREEIAEAQFYAWRRTIARRDAEAADATPAFMPAMVTGLVAAPPSIAVEWPGGRVLRLPESTPAERLAALVHALESRAQSRGGAR